MTDKREVIYRDKRMDKLFPGEGYSLSPEKSSKRNNATEKRRTEFFKGESTKIETKQTGTTIFIPSL